MRSSAVFLGWVALLHLMLAVVSLPSTPFSWAYMVPSLDSLIILAVLFVILAVMPRGLRMTCAGLGGVALLLAFLGFGNSIMQTYFPRPLELATDLFLLDSLVNLAEQSDRMPWFVGGGVGLAVLTLIWGAGLFFALERIGRLFLQKTPRVRAGLMAITLLGIGAIMSVGITEKAGFPGRNGAYIVSQVGHFLRESRSFDASEIAAVQAARHEQAAVPGFLSGLEGRDVFVFLVEAYGEVVFGDPAFRSGVATELAEFSATIAEKNWHAKSGYLESPVYGGNSWIADAAFACGIPVRTELRFRKLRKLGLPCMAPMFRSAGWETISIRPATMHIWPEGDVFGFEHFVAGFNIKYHGPKYYWSPMPDQYALAWYQLKTLQDPALKKGAPRLAYFQLTSSHAPFNRIPVPMDDWQSLVDSHGQDLNKAMVYSYPFSWWDLKGAEEGYLQAVRYDLTVIKEYLRRYAPPHFVALILGDHQPASPITGERPFDVPMHVISDDADVLGAMSGFGLQDGLDPTGTTGRPMHQFLDYFLKAYSSPDNVGH